MSVPGRAHHGFGLLLKSAGDGEGILVEVYEGFPFDRQKAILSAVLPYPALEKTGIAGALGRVFEGHPDGLREAGDCLAGWLFYEAPPDRLNSIGSFLSQQLQMRKSRVWFCLDPFLVDKYWEFRLILFECLRFSILFPLGVARFSSSRFAAVNSSSSFRGRNGIEGKLRILLACANPDRDKDIPKVRHLPGLESHFESLCRALDPLVHAGEVFLEILPRTTPQQLRESLLKSDAHVVVFAGHGYWMPPTGLATSEDRYGGLWCVSDGVPAKCPFAELLSDLAKQPKPSLRLGVFVACQSYVAAPNLLAAGIPAVVAMQPIGQKDFPLPGTPVFATAFFTRLARFQSITDAYDAALRELGDSSALASIKRTYAALMPTLWLAGNDSSELFESAERRFENAYLDAVVGKFWGAS